jgi:hypothetical protein
MQQDMDPSLSNALRETAEELRQEFEEKLQSQRRELENLILARPADEAVEVTAKAAEPMEEIAAEVSPTLDSLEELKHAAREIDQAQSQAEVLEALIRGASRFASRTAVFLNREGGLQGWGGSGFGLQDQAIKDLALDYEPGSVWERITGAEGGLALAAADCASLCNQLEVESPTMGLLLPFVLGDRVAAALYFDRVESEAPFHISALQLLCFMAGQTLETLPFRNRVSTGTLQLTVTEPVPPSVEPEPAIVEAEAPAAEPEPPAVEPEPLVAEPEPLGIEPEPLGIEPEPPVVEPEPMVAEPELPVAEPELPVVEPEPPVVEEAAPDFQTIPEESAAEVWPERLDEELPAVGPEPLPLEPEFLEPPPSVEISEEAPVAEVAPGFPEPIEEPVTPEPEAIVPEPVVAPPAEEEVASEITPLTPPPAEPPAPSVAPTPGGPPPPATQVAPPEDIDGPGWAFTTTRIPTAAGNEALHEEARRLARLLVTEIKLYNEETVEEGRRAQNVYVRLKEDIERSRQIYEDRIDAGVRNEKDYFQEALVRILAAGDPKALGI